MSGTNELNKMTYKDFFSLLEEMKGISRLWIKMLDMLLELDPKLSDEVMKLFCIYFSLLDDGNTCISLKDSVLKEKWSEKWNGLILVNEGKTDIDVEAKDFDSVIDAALNSFTEKTLDKIVLFADNGIPLEACYSLDKAFIAVKINDEPWLFTSKYYFAKLSIEDRIRVLFNKDSGKKTKASATKKDASYFEKIFGKRPNPEQLEAILRGQSENLIITGGPGTGKTTVICYLLWELFREHPEYLDYSVYMAAPSGKAADRLSESVHGSLEKINSSEKQKHEEIFAKLNHAESYTIHRLLNYKPFLNGFGFNRENQFEEKSIFIIDEASMIDICLFKSLLEAIPDNARIFILGDKNQLPSVSAGAVLGELLGKKEDSVAALKTSMRFDENSSVSILSKAIQDENADISNLAEFSNWESIADTIDFGMRPKNASTEDKNPIEYITLDEGKKYDEIKQISRMWSEKFCHKTAQLAVKLQAEKTKAEVKVSELDELWNESINAKILCAERQSIRGVSTINGFISKDIISTNKILFNESDRFFTGELLMVTKNKNDFKLYNGDSGIVIMFKADPLKYLMVKKEVKDADENSGEIREGIFNIGSYVFFPMYLLSSEYLEMSYAITVHKSQGSDYKNIMVFLPEQKGHPLLNRQILYTAITRTSGLTYIVATPEALDNAKETIITRDTQINCNV